MSKGLFAPSSHFKPLPMLIFFVCLLHCLTAPAAQSVLHGCQPCNKFLSECHPCTPFTPLGYTRKPIASHLCPSLARIPGIPRMNPAHAQATQTYSRKAPEQPGGIQV